MLGNPQVEIAGLIFRFNGRPGSKVFRVARNIVPNKKPRFISSMGSIECSSYDLGVSVGCLI